MDNLKTKILICIFIISALVLALSWGKYEISLRENSPKHETKDFYKKLPADTNEGNPLEGIADDFTTSGSFTSNLPLAVIHFNEPLAEYKDFSNRTETVFEDVDPWTSATISLYETENGKSSLSNIPYLSSDILIKKRGHTSYKFDKSQYYIKLVDEKGNENPANVFGMGEEDSWILNGSMADKSMIRNYLAYRIAAQIMIYAPHSTFCEMFTEDKGVYTYQGVYLMMDAVKKSENRVNIDSAKTKNVYTSYLVRRDRKTNFDYMLDTYGRFNGLDDGYIGVKYPGQAKQTEANLKFIAEDFSKIEKIMYSPKKDVFMEYPEYIDVETFLDYFIINEYFGNYDAGEHSTYMYKESGGKLKIGPVWDFDQAMNNSIVDEEDPLSIAMQDKTFFKQLCTDKTFLRQLKKRYSQLESVYLNDKYMIALIDETTNYLKSARVREWYRWGADYLDDSGANPGNYYLTDYQLNGERISRFNDNYDQEIYNIKVYLSRHGKVIQSEITALEDDATVTSGIAGQVTLILIMVCVLFFIPSIIINRK